MRLPFALGVSLLAALAAMPANAQGKYANKLAPYVASPIRLVDRMLELANIKPGETVYRSGFGRRARFDRSGAKV